MKYKILLTGKNNAVVDDFFGRMNEKFESLTTSERFEDIANHLNYYKPDIFVYCLSYENKKNASQVASIRECLLYNGIPLALIGSEEECLNFIQRPVKDAELVMHKPISANEIESRIVDYLEEQQRLKEERIRAKHERIAQEKAAKKKHILVIDDDSRMLKLIKEYVHEEYDVATALNGKVAMKFLEKKRTDLILLDYEMPDEDGPAVLEKLRANEETKDIPVIFLTGTTERNKILKALSLKPQDYLLKPIQRDKLMEAITKHIGQKLTQDVVAQEAEKR